MLEVSHWSIVSRMESCSHVGSEFRIKKAAIAHWTVARIVDHSGSSVPHQAVLQENYGIMLDMLS